MPSEEEKIYDPHRFQTTATYYERYRLGYPDLLIRRVIERLCLKPGDAVLDLGCGPGLLAVPFAKAGMKVLGVDPEPEMLEAARAAATAAGVPAEFQQGSSFDLRPGIGPFKLVTMGRAFHWMDRTETPKILDRLIAPGGALALFDDTHLHTMENRWRKVLNDLGMTYSSTHAPHYKERERKDYRRHESYLFESPFSHLETVGVVVKREINADDVVGLGFSLSLTSPHKLGDRKDAFEAELRAALTALSPENRFIEIAEMNALIATRA